MTVRPFRNGECLGLAENRPLLHRNAVCVRPRSGESVSSRAGDAIVRKVCYISASRMPKVVQYRRDFQASIALGLR